MSKENCKSGHVYTEELSDNLERGPYAFDRIILNIGGLKCGCCESGISRALHQIPAIRNHQVNIMLARVEFDLDTGRFSVEEVIAHLHRATGYTFENYEQPESQILELLVENPAEILQTGRPFGVNLIESTTKTLWSPSMLFSGRNSTIPTELPSKHQHSSRCETTTKSTLHQQKIRIHYDAHNIGARDVLRYYQELAPSQILHLAPPSAHPSLAIGHEQTKRACIMFLLTLVLTIPVLVFAWGPLDHNRLVYAHVSMALATLVQAIATREFLPGALRSLIYSGLFEMDFLIAMSTTTAYIFSVVSYVFKVQKRPLETDSFFETSTLLVTLILLGRVVSEFARLKAAKSVSFRSLQAESALLVDSGPGPAKDLNCKSKSSGSKQCCPTMYPEFTSPHKIDARLLQYGDTFKVPPHTRIVTDGIVTYGGSEVDESMITGETIPVAKGLDNRVCAGTMNGAGQLIVALTALPHENSISRIASMVDNAELSKPKVQALADQIAGWFVPAIAAIGILVFLIWVFVDRYHNHRTWAGAVVKAITYAIATLIVSCPCAIGLAVPMVVLIAGGASARFGIIFRDPQKLEVARNVTDIIFDKTGTLTTGELTVVEIYFPGNSIQTKGMILGLLEDVKHPVAMAVCKWVRDEPQKDGAVSVLPTKMAEIKSVPGCGVQGVGKESKLVVRAGNPQWLGVQVLESQHTLLCVTISGVLSATFRLQDRARQGAIQSIDLITARGIKVHMISGDSDGAVNDTAHSLNIPKHQTKSRLKPEDKQKYVQDIQNAGGVVMFCGDGTNDSVALKQADVGVHINHGSDVAKSASDVVLMTSHLHHILILLDISKAAYRRIMFNFGWAALYNVVAILMAAGAFVKIRIEPAYAGLGELVSILPVVMIAFQLRWRNYGKQYRALEYE
ncbi:heavy metal translocatin [Amniculicola lignicola CBS 123094]|uniref:Heavy metal translocatin n=1 Tax=Amniculicola lignicola CBS 123094 TaxID=1392246 RepID=A0A6A5WJ33_9PLEO|nr:heavy metal translocatin [Amniculicola lignicola CBS 123094]